MSARSRYILLLLPALLWKVPGSRAQIPGPMGDLFRKIREHNGAYMAYDYEIRLKRLSDSRITDSVKGHLCNASNHYRDSNSVFFTAKAGDWYCKLNYAKKTAVVYNLKELSARMKFSTDAAPADMYGINEAMLSEQTVVKIDTSDRQIYRMVCQFRGQKLQRLRLDLNRDDYSLVAAEFEALEGNDPYDKDPYVRIYRINNVQKHDHAPLPDLSGIFREEQGKVILNQRYANYTLNELPR